MVELRDELMSEEFIRREAELKHSLQSQKRGKQLFLLVIVGVFLDGWDVLRFELSLADELDISLNRFKLSV